MVYYLQFALLNTQYADGAVGNVRNMLKPLTVHAIKVEVGGEHTPRAGQDSGRSGKHVNG